MKTYEFLIAPIGAVRMNKGDLLPWKLRSGRARSAVYRYLDYKDKLSGLIAQSGFVMPESGYWIEFYIAMPQSWSKKKKLLMHGTKHRNKPDKDNLEKAFLDVVCKETGDAKIWDGGVSKFWCNDNEERIYIEIYNDNFSQIREIYKKSLS